jgi:hypothetical protein
MPRLRINLRELTEVDELDLMDELSTLAEREARESRDGDDRDRRVINPVALQRRQDSRKWGKEIAKFHRQNKREKP